MRAAAAGQRRRRRRRRSRRLRLVVFLVSLVVVLAFAALGGRSQARHAAGSAPAVKVTARPRLTLQVAAGPIPGELLIADRGNNRILLVDNRKRILWRYPRAGGPAYPFKFDDDAFFGPGYRSIISNQEHQHTLQIIGFPGGQLLWRYGHPNTRGSAAGYLNTPDDAYQLPGGLVSVADAYNCRVLFIDRAHRIVRELGQAGVCAHVPPGQLGAVNGATPLPGGGTLVSEISGSWIDAFSHSGRLLWDFQAPVIYPSDPQWLGGGHILLADYARPGHVLILDTHGRVLWRYGPASGPGMLDHPSLAMRLRPGLLAVNDDYRDRVVLISIHRHRIVWQYGHTDRGGSGPGYLNAPDGMDLLPARQALAAPAGRALARRPMTATTSYPQALTALKVRSAPFRLPSPVERAVAVAWQGRILIAGGLDAAGQSATGVFALDPTRGRLRSLGSLPLAFHDGAAALIGDRLYVFGGGTSTSTNAVQAFDPNTGRGGIVGRLPRPLSDLAAAQLAGVTYLVGGFDGQSPRPEILATRDGRRFTLAGTLPVGLRYPAVAAAGGKLLVVGGQTAMGLSTVVYAFDPATGRTQPLAHLPAPVAHAAALTNGDSLYVIGGSGSAGTPSGTISAVDLATHTVHQIALPTGPLADAARATLGSTTFLIGGRRGQPLPIVLEIQTRR
jgi:Kelch motif protein